MTLAPRELPQAGALRAEFIAESVKAFEDDLFRHLMD